jgi:hypothetical protein
MQNHAADAGTARCEPFDQRQIKQQRCYLNGFNHTLSQSSAALIVRIKKKFQFNALTKETRIRPFNIHHQIFHWTTECKINGISRRIELEFRIVGWNFASLWEHPDVDDVDVDIVEVVSLDNIK